MPAVDPAVPHEISVVIPLYNEEESLPLLAAELQTTLQALNRPYEVLFVDDGSTGGSAAVLARLAQADPALRVLRLRRNAGQSAALAAGFRAARGAIVVTLDADLQNDPADIPASWPSSHMPTRSAASASAGRTAGCAASRHGSPTRCATA